jgi:hypothetical protein
MVKLLGSLVTTSALALFSSCLDKNKNDHHFTFTFTTRFCICMFKEEEAQGVIVRIWIWIRACKEEETVRIFTFLLSTYLPCPFHHYLPLVYTHTHNTHRHSARDKAKKSHGYLSLPLSSLSTTCLHTHSTRDKTKKIPWLSPCPFHHYLPLVYTHTVPETKKQK